MHRRTFTRVKFTGPEGSPHGHSCSRRRRHHFERQRTGGETPTHTVVKARAVGGRPDPGSVRRFLAGPGQRGDRRIRRVAPDDRVRPGRRRRVRLCDQGRGRHCSPAAEPGGQANRAGCDDRDGARIRCGDRPAGDREWGWSLGLGAAVDRDHDRTVAAVAGSSPGRPPLPARRLGADHRSADSCRDAVGHRAGGHHRHRRRNPPPDHRRCWLPRPRRGSACGEAVRRRQRRRLSRGAAMNDRRLHVVFGAGQVGRALATRLTELGLTVRLVSRNRPAALSDGIEWRPADATDPEAAAGAAAGASVVYQCLNAPYTDWPKLFPSLQRGVMGAAERSGALLVSLENIYGYGQTAGAAMTEDLPLAATTVKGRVRVAMTEELQAASAAGRLRIAIGRASDFFGAGVTESSLGERIFANAVAGKRADFIGNPDLPHTYSYVPDIAEGLAPLGTDERAVTVGVGEVRI